MPDGKSAVKKKPMQDAPRGALLKSFVCALALTALCAFFFPNVKIPDFDAQKKPSFMALSDGTQTALDASGEEMGDYTPMFLPTKWNSSSRIAEKFSELNFDNALLKGAKAADFEPKMDFLGAEKPEPLNESAMKVGAHNFFASFGRGKASEVKGDGGNFLYAHVADFNSSKQMGVLRIPAPEGANSALSTPSAFAVQIDLTGSPVSLVALDRNDSDGAGARLMDTLLDDKAFRKLPAGYYKITVTP